jgi:hypothetical protein
MLLNTSVGLRTASTSPDVLMLWEFGAVEVIMLSWIIDGSVSPVVCRVSNFFSVDFVPLALSFTQMPVKLMQPTNLSFC